MPSGPAPITCAVTIWWPDFLSKLSSWRSDAFSLAAALSSTTWRRSASSAARNRAFSARSDETSPKTDLTRSSCAAIDVIASSAGASALFAAPRAPAAQDCWLTIASRSIAAKRVTKSRVDRGGLLAEYMALVAKDPCAASPQHDPVQGVDLLEHDAGPAHHARQRVVRDPHRHQRLVCEELVQAREHGPAPADDDPTLDDVLDQPRRSRVDRRLHRPHAVDQHAAQ